jgi:hypothetical protein
MSDATSTVSITEDSPKTSGGSAMSTITMTGANDEPTSMSQPEDGSSSNREKSDAQHQLSLELMWQQPVLEQKDPRLPREFLQQTQQVVKVQMKERRLRKVWEKAH